MTEDTTPDGLAGGDDEEAPEDPTPSRAGWRKVVGIAAAAVLAVGGGAWGAMSILGGGDDSSTPSPSAPGPSPSPTASVVPSVAPSAVILDATPGVLTTVMGLPAAEVVPAGVLESAPPGSVLMVYRPIGSWAEGPEAQALYLALPTGEVYQLLDLSPTSIVRFVYWRLGDTTAVIEVGREIVDLDENGNGSIGREWDGYVTVDLITGETTPWEGPPVDPEAVWAGSHGSDTDLWLVPADDGGLLYLVGADGGTENLGAYGQKWGSTRVLLSPDGSRVIRDTDGGYEVLTIDTRSTVSGSLDLEGQGCAVNGWWDEDHLLVGCGLLVDEEEVVIVSELQKAEYVVAVGDDLATGQEPLVRMTTGDPQVGRVATVADGVVAFGGVILPEQIWPDGLCDDGAYLLDAEGFTAIPHTVGAAFGHNIYDVTTAGGRYVITFSVRGCSSDTAAAALSIYDVTTGEIHVIGPVSTTPEGWEMTEGLTSYIVGR